MRRSLRNSLAEVDVSRHLLPVEGLPCPWDAEALFGRRAALEVEVGSGKGLFLQGAGMAHPERDFLGIELAAKYARLTAARVARLGLANVRVVSGDALRVFAEMLPDRGVSAVHVYFPDPWWKKRHHKRRVMTERFVADVARVLAVGGALHFWTDVEEYFQSTLALIATGGAFSSAEEESAREAEHDLDYRTHFERRMRQAGEAVYRARFVRREI